MANTTRRRQAAPLRSSPFTVSRDTPLSQHTRFGIGWKYPASIPVDAPDPASFVSALQLARSSGLHYVVIGAGSNLIVPDDGFCGVVLKLTARTITINDSQVMADCRRRAPDPRADTTVGRHGLQGP